ncbi:hypothetical protein GCK72_004741 [Caenorhabditis remanei]|uniref:Uncharacterized protein n=1 Tax=Caenorhabditis remanei TaxID=31234 RepID=A0A6A5HCZ7_CAERE|nr:hypothetical protein GCK72_004741 [Caenorhabditis remanei]KAF1764791.1 hypothetical protein GCK72_004741 [Caenorhabditis remanei]
MSHCTLGRQCGDYGSHDSGENGGCLIKPVRDNVAVRDDVTLFGYQRHDTKLESERRTVDKENCWGGGED